MKNNHILLGLVRSYALFKTSTSNFTLTGIFLFILLFSHKSFGQSGQFKIRNDAFVQIGYGSYKTLTFGQETNSPNNGKFALEYCTSCSPAGFNLWKPWPSPGAANYLLFIRDNGFVGIGNSGDATGQYRLNVSGKIQCTGLNILSDSRLKQNVKPINNALIDLNRIAIYEYQFKQDLDKPIDETTVNEQKENGAKNFGFDKGKHFGVMAQELENIYPDLVSKNEDGYKSVNYMEMIPLLIKSIQEMNTIVDKLETKVQALEKKITELEKK